MKKIVLLSSLLLTFHLLSAQIAIKLYQNLDYVRYDVKYGTYDEDPEIYFARTSLAIQFANRNDLFHEIEFSYAQEAIPAVHVVYPQSEWHNTKKDYAGMQYELNKVFGRASALRFSLGGGVLLYGLINRQEPKTPFAYRSEDRYIGTILNLIPRLQYNISKRLLVDLNFKFQLFDVHFFEYRTNSPMLPVRQQKENSVETEFFPAAYNVRIGVGYKLQ